MRVFNYKDKKYIINNKKSYNKNNFILNLF